MLTKNFTIVRLAFSIVLALTAGAVAEAGVMGFTAEYAPGNWTLIQNGGDGSVDASGAPTSISITSSDTGSGDSIDTDYTVAATAAGTVSFSWNFLSNDVDGASFDPFGYLLNGVFTQLSNDVGSSSQMGTESFAVLQGDVFGFRAETVDDSLGSATTTIIDFSAPGGANATVPEPASLAIWGVIGLAGMAVRKRRVRRK